MKLKSFSKQIAGVGAVVALGLSVSGTAVATPFSVNATVQNALTVTNVNDMNLGTLFATSASTGYYRYMILSPAGTFSASQGSASTTLLSLGGMSAATGRLNALTTAPFTVTLPDASTSAALSPGGSGAYTLTGTAVNVNNLASPGTSAHFELVNFRAGNPTNGTADTGCTSANTCQITPTAAGNVDWNVGATVVTGQSANTSFATGAYLGSFDITATY